jgi:hypothetical protein
MDPNNPNSLKQHVSYLDAVLSHSTLPRAVAAFGISGASYLTSSWPQTPSLWIGIVLLCGTIGKRFAAKPSLAPGRAEASEPEDRPVLPAAPSPSESDPPEH